MVMAATRDRRSMLPPVWRRILRAYGPLLLLALGFLLLAWLVPTVDRAPSGDPQSLAGLLVAVVGR